jgi:hypothetical protein
MVVNSVTSFYLVGSQEVGGKDNSYLFINHTLT